MNERGEVPMKSSSSLTPVVLDPVVLEYLLSPVQKVGHEAGRER
jgi:hypothetical protein